jgi:hypothetical protein
MIDIPLALAVLSSWTHPNKPTMKDTKKTPVYICILQVNAYIDFGVFRLWKWNCKITQQEREM